MDNRRVDFWFRLEMLGGDLKGEAWGRVKLRLKREHSAWWIFADFFRDFFLDEES